MKKIWKIIIYQSFINKFYSVHPDFSTKHTARVEPFKYMRVNTHKFGVLTIKSHCCFWIFPQSWCELWMVPYNEDLEKMHLLRQNTKRKKKKKAKLPVYFFFNSFFRFFPHSKYWFLRYLIFSKHKSFSRITQSCWEFEY